MSGDPVRSRAGVLTKLSDRAIPRRPATRRILCCYPVSMRFNCTALVLAGALLARGPAAAQTAVTPATGDATFTIFLRGTQIGREQVNVSRGPSGWIISSTGRTEAPLDFTIAQYEMKYGPDWQPLELTLDAR